MPGLLDNTLHDLWLSEAKAGRPPDPRMVAEMQFGLVVNWSHQEAFLDLIKLIDPASPKKNFACVEKSRGAGKSTIVNFFRLYVAEYILPFLERPGLPIRPENRRYVIFGRDQNHLRDELLVPLRDMIINHAPWLRTPDWKGIVGDTDDPDPEALRELSEMKSKGGQKWESFRLDLANGVSFRTRTLKQSARSLHVFVGDMDDILTEQTVGDSPAIMALIRGAIKPAIEPGGLFLLDGTPQAPGDLFDLAKDDPDWLYSAYPAYDVDGKLGYEAKNRSWLGEEAYAALLEVDRRSVWPARLTYAYLEQERGNTRDSELKYIREYLLERAPPETALVHPDLIFAARDSELSYHHGPVNGFHYYAGVDPSSLKHDEAGFCVGYVLEGGVRIPANMSKLVANPHLPDGEGEMKVIEKMNELADAYRVYDWVAEKNGFQGVIIGLMRRLNASIRCEPFQLGANKHTENGWLGIRTLFRNRCVKLPYSTDEDKLITDEFVYQLRGLQYINGEIIEDPKRLNDLVSAFFLFTKASDTAQAVFSATAFVTGPVDKLPTAVKLPGTIEYERPGAVKGGEHQCLNRRRTATGKNHLQTVQARMERWRQHRNR